MTSNLTSGNAWTEIEAMVDQVHGWTPLEQLYALYMITYLTSDLEGDVLEIGSWCGRSAVVLAAAAKAGGKSRVHCVDLFPERSDWKQNPDGSYSFELTIDGRRYGGYKEQTVWKEPFETQLVKAYDRHPGVYEYFNETIARNGMGDVVRAYRGDLEAMLPKLGTGFKCRVAFVDGDHGYDAVCQDIRNIDRCLVAGGWLCFDDAFTSYEGVNRAISELVVANPAYELCRQMTRKLFVARKRTDG